MLKIGDFSKLSRLSIRMLRYYDELGLLRPEWVDRETGYRYYSESQLSAAGRILMFREMGFGLQTMGELLDACGDPERLSQFLRLKRSELQEERTELDSRLQRLENALNRIGKDELTMKYEVTMKTLPERYVASVRDILPAYDYEGRLWHTLMKETAPLGLKEAEPCLTFGFYHNEEGQEQNVDVEIQMTVEGKYENTEHVVFKTMPPVRFASATYTGSYDYIAEASAAVAQWMRDNGYALDGAPFAIYHVSPHETQNPDELVTEMCYPVKKA